VDKIAPQWLVMSILNFTSLIYFLTNQKTISHTLKINLKAALTLSYLGFIIWAACSFFYAINPTEVIVNISRQVNVMLMFIIMFIFLFSLKNKLRLIPWIIALIFLYEIYAVLNEAIVMIQTGGGIVSGNLKGVTANRNITAFSLAMKIPFLLFLIQIEKKFIIKIILSIIICLGLICLSMIQSRASFIAIGFMTIMYFILHLIIYLRINRKWVQVLHVGYLVIPLFCAILVNQTILSDKGADAVSRAASISISTNDGSVNQRLRYYEDVITHMASNPILGVGLGNWKLKSINYDSEDIVGYVVPYHAHSDFIQLGAELGIFGFALYFAIFLISVYYVYYLIRFSNLDLNEKVFLFLMLTALGIYSVDANLNFPIARPQVLVVWALVIALITGYYQKYRLKSLRINKKNYVSQFFLIVSVAVVIPTIYVSNKVYESQKGQMFLLQDFNSNSFNIPLNQVETIVPDIPNITVTTIPISSVKARYFVNAKQYEKALSMLDKGTVANPYLYYSEILKSQIYKEKGQLDKAKEYAKKAFFGLPNNDLHASSYINLINITRDRVALEEAFELLTAKNKINNWKNYLIVASGLYPAGDSIIKARAKKATKIFTDNQEIQALYRQVAVGQNGLNMATSFASKGLDLFNKKDYSNAAEAFEKAIEFNPLDYTHYENAATSNYLIGNFEKAIDQINVVVNDLNPLNGKCEYIKAIIFIQIGDPIGACPLLERSRDSGYIQSQATIEQYCN
jgi:O-antigen ligase/tetratricopeptide (TPR) repeat protein